MDETKKLIAGYGSVVDFKNYNDSWIVDCVRYTNDGRIEVVKLGDFEQPPTHVTTYQNNDKPCISEQASAIYIDNLEEITITPLFEAIKTERLFYNQFPSLNDRVFCLHASSFGDHIDLALDVCRKTKQTGVIQYCSSNDQRLLIPVVNEDTRWDVNVRWRLYIKQLQF